jgi:serine O-acetyltransferase
MTAAAFHLDDVVAALCKANADLLVGRQRKFGQHHLPSRDELERVVAGLRGVLFPGHFGASDLSPDGVHYYVGHTLGLALTALQEQIRRGLLFACEHGGDPPCGTCEARAVDITRQIASQLPALREVLGTDACAAFEGDPAATSPDEAVFCYPGMTAILHHRIAHEIYRLGVPMIARIVSELAHSATGIDIHPGATIGSRFFIDHGTGVVIGETSRIGNSVRLYQGVTLGAKSFPVDDRGQPLKGLPRHPIVEDDVVIYAGATILGRITIGRGARVGGNVWITQDVPAGSRISQAVVREELFDGGSGI